MVMMTNQFVSTIYHSGDPTRMGAQVISGIGFLGAGTILVTKNKQVRGLTTAAGMWTAATIGLAIGVGFYSGAIVGALTLFIIMIALHPLKIYIQKRSKIVDVYLVFESIEAFNRFLIQTADQKIKVEILRNGFIEFDTLYTANDQKDEFGCFISFKMQERFNHLNFIEELLKRPGIRYVEEIK